MQQSTFEAKIQIGLFNDPAIIALSEKDNLTDDTPEKQLIRKDIEFVGTSTWLDDIKPANTTLGPGQYQITGTGTFEDSLPTYSNIKISAI